MLIRPDDITHPKVLALLAEHLANMYEITPAESVHAFDVSRLRAPGVSFWTAWNGDELLGCGALKEIDPKHGEVKSMRTPASLRRRGAGRALLSHIVDVARNRNYERLSLETGAMKEFVPARRLYESFGFEYCGPFEGYTVDPNSMFMTLRL